MGYFGHWRKGLGLGRQCLNTVGAKPRRGALPCTSPLKPYLDVVVQGNGADF